MIFRVDLQAQYLAYRAEIDAAVARVLGGGRYTLGPELEQFEHEFARYLHVPDVIGVADGTRAIVLALRVLGVKPGAEVITTPFTAIPTIGAIIESGAVPVLVDIDPDTYLVDLDQVAAAVTSRTRAVVPVHMFGNVVDILALRERIGPDIFIVEDAAQAHGSRLGASFAGTMGDIVCHNPTIARELRMLRNHGMRDKDICDLPGTNSRLDELQAAILRAKLAHLDEMNAARTRLVARYLEVLPSNRFRPQKVPPGVVTNWHVFELRFDGNRDGLVKHLETRGIQTNVYYVVPHHLQPALAHLGYRKGSLPNTE